MKTFKVDVSYIGFGPDETPERSGETHIVEATDELDAEAKAIAKCVHQGMCEDAEAIATLYCRVCQNTGYQNDGGGDVHPCEEANHERAA